MSLFGFGDKPAETSAPAVTTLVPQVEPTNTVAPTVETPVPSAQPAVEPSGAIASEPVADAPSAPGRGTKDDHAAFVASSKQAAIDKHNAAMRADLKHR